MCSLCICGKFWLFANPSTWDEERFGLIMKKIGWRCRNRVPPRLSRGRLAWEEMTIVREFILQWPGEDEIMRPVEQDMGRKRLPAAVKLQEPVMEKLRELLPEIVERFPALQVLYLFGSQATGGARSDSDVDLAVYFDDDAYQANPLLDLELGLLVEGRMRRPVDVVVMQRVSPIMAPGSRPWPAPFRTGAATAGSIGITGFQALP
jgi:predicted nucleotidyltransferase